MKVRVSNRKTVWQNRVTEDDCTVRDSVRFPSLPYLSVEKEWIVPMVRFVTETAGSESPFVHSNEAPRTKFNVRDCNPLRH